NLLRLLLCIRPLLLPLNLPLNLQASLPAAQAIILLGIPLTNPLLIPLINPHPDLVVNPPLSQALYPPPLPPTRLRLGVKLLGTREDTVKVVCVRTTALIMAPARGTITAS